MKTIVIAAQKAGAVKTTLVRNPAVAASHEGRAVPCLVLDPPAAPEWLAEVLGAVDLVLIPVRPSPDDLRAVGATIAAVNAARVPFAYVLSQLPRAKITDEAARAIAQHGLVTPVNIAQRVSYAETGAGCDRNN